MTQTADLPGIVVTGASGRMGRMLVQTVAASGKARLVGAVERPGNPWVGQDIGTAMGGPALGVTVTVEFAALAAQARAVHVIGTTGLEAEHLAKIRAAARHAVIVRAGNMSLGVNLLARLTRLEADADQRADRLEQALLLLDEDGYLDINSERIRFLSFLLRDYWRRNHER
jgi:4-hydroxy-tetrahydrodipicolinate reductase